MGVSMIDLVVRAAVALALPLAPAAASATPSADASLDAARGRAVAPLSVLSFNMQHRDRPEHLAVLADRLEADLARLPDFILCQEVLFERADWKGADDTASVLAEALAYYCHGTRRTSDREGVAILSRYPFVYWSQRDLKARTSPFLLGFRRVSVMGEFLVPNLGRVRVVNVHLAYWSFEHHVRRKQLAETLDWVAAREREVPADVTILGGDFNIEPGWNEMALVTAPDEPAELVFMDFNTEHPTRGTRGAPIARVDYIFVAAPQREVVMLGERRLYEDGLVPEPGAERLWLSDHLPLLHEYAVGAPRRAVSAP